MPPADVEQTQWREIVRLVRAYARRKYGDDADGFTIHLTRWREGQRQHYEPFPPAWLDDGPTENRS